MRQKPEHIQPVLDIGNSHNVFAKKTQRQSDQCRFQKANKSVLSIYIHSYLHFICSSRINTAN